MNPKRNYYKILNVKQDSDKKTIKKAYKKLVLKYHPDINQSINATKNFKLINEAYSILSDNEKRREYDNKRKALIQQLNTSKKENKIKIRNVKKRRKSNLPKYIKFAGEIEKEYGIISGILGLNTKTSRRGHGNNSFNLVSNLLNLSTSSNNGHHRHRYRGDKY